MLLTIDLSTDEAIALRRFCSGHQLPSLEAAAARALREYLISIGKLDVLPVIDEDSDVAGSA